MRTPSINPHKDSYKVRNREAYTSSLCQRGSLTLFLDEAVLQEWAQLSNKKKAVGERTYSQSIIQCCLLVRMNYRLRLRQSTGFLKSLFRFMNIPHLPVPDYTTLCRRQKDLPVTISRRLAQGENLVAGIDSTGLKVYGEGEWKVRQHGYTKRRTWKKLHICVDLNTQELLSVSLTGNDIKDATAGKQMLEGNTAHITTFKGDGGYDDFSFRKVLGSGITQIIPPPRSAVIQKAKKSDELPGYLEQRNEAVAYIARHGSRQWKKRQGYHRRSLNETVMFRYKTIFGGHLAARTTANQQTEVAVKCLLLNMFTAIGMPVSYKVA